MSTLFAHIHPMHYLSGCYATLYCPSIAISSKLVTPSKAHTSTKKHEQTNSQGFIAHALEAEGLFFPSRRQVYLIFQFLISVSALVLTHKQLAMKDEE